MKNVVKRELNKFLKIYRWTSSKDINWTKLSWHSHISIDFMEAFQDKLDWHGISVNQRLSEKNVIKFKDRLDLDLLFKSKKITLEFYKKHRKPLSRFQLLDFS